MTFPILVESWEGQFAATLVGAPDVRGIASTRDDAIAALKNLLAERIAHGELVSLEMESSGLGGLAGAFADDSSLPGLCAEAYRDRDDENRG